MMADLTERIEDALRWYARKLAALGELHAPLRIYDECGHDHPRTIRPASTATTSRAARRRSST